MKKEIYECEVCKKRTKEHFCDEIGWIVIKGESILISQGRDKNGTAKSIYKVFSELHFCSEKCFLHWLRRA